MDDLPTEMMACIFSYFVNPYTLVSDLIVWRQINRTTYEMLENNSSFERLFNIVSCRDVIGNLSSSAMICDSEDDSDDEVEEYGQLFSNLKSHVFIDELLQQTLRNRFIGYKRGDDWNYGTAGRRLIPRSDLNLFDDSAPNFHAKVREAIDSYSKCKTCILQLLLEISLGKEMIEHLGMRNIGHSIVSFFYKLFEPAIQTVSNWKEQPRSVLEFSDIFNSNLFEFLEMAMKKETFLKDEMSNFWFEMETINNSIPRQIILFIAENFSHLNIKLLTGEEIICSIFIFEELRKFGICVEKLRFIDERCKMYNFQRTSSLNRIIPLSSNGFYLQHFAVWINSIPLLEYFLNVDSTQTNSMLSDYFSASDNMNNVSLNSYSKTYIVDHSMFSVLHYATIMNNVEMVDILINKYMANPLFKHHSSLSIAIRKTRNVLRGRRNEEDKILQIILDRYGLNCMESELEKLNLNSKEIEIDRTDDISKDEDDDYETEHIPLNEHCIVEELAYTPESNINDYPSDEEYEEGLSYSKLIDKYNEIHEESNNILKRKRFDPVVIDETVYNYIQTDVKDSLSHFEKDTWDSELARQCLLYSNSVTQLSKVELLARNGVKKIKLDHQEAIRTGDISDELIESREESCIIPKQKMNDLIDEVLQDYGIGMIVMPNARMLLQQACEKYVSESLSTAATYSQFLNSHHATLLDKDMSINFRSNKMQMDRFGLVFRNDRSCENQFKVLLGENNLENIQIFSAYLLECIGRFESFSSGDDEEGDDYIDNISSCSSDSVVSAVCLVKSEFENIAQNCYSSISVEEYQDFNSDIVQEDSLNHKYIEEIYKNHSLTVQFYNDRDEAVDALNGF